MKSKFTYNFPEKKIVGSKRSIERANKGLEPEYSELTGKLAEHPNFNVAVKIINMKEDKNTHKGLGFERMEKFINLLDNSEEVLKEFKAVQEISEARGSKYPSTKKWFFETFPEFKTAKTEEEMEAVSLLIASKINALAKRVA